MTGGSVKRNGGHRSDGRSTAANQRKANPEAAIPSAEKLALARDLVKSHVSAPLDDKEIEARIEEDLASRDLALNYEYVAGRLAPRVEKAP